MKKSMKFATALAGAAVVVAGGSAFTAGNTMPTDPTTMGYSETTVSGFTATDVDYTYDTDRTHVTKIEFTNSDTAMVIADTDAKIKLLPSGSQVACVPSAVPDEEDRTGTLITCTVSAANDTATLTGYQLTVTTNEVSELG